jgi:hypothetical protein
MSMTSVAYKRKLGFSNGPRILATPESDVSSESDPDADRRFTFIVFYRKRILEGIGTRDEQILGMGCRQLYTYLLDNYTDDSPPLSFDAPDLLRELTLPLIQSQNLTLCEQILNLFVFFTGHSQLPDLPDLLDDTVTARFGFFMSTHNETLITPLVRFLTLLFDRQDLRTYRVFDIVPFADIPDIWQNATTTDLQEIVISFLSVAAGADLSFPDSYGLAQVCDSIFAYPNSNAVTAAFWGILSVIKQHPDHCDELAANLTELPVACSNWITCDFAEIRRVIVLILGYFAVLKAPLDRFDCGIVLPNLEDDDEAVRFAACWAMTTIILARDVIAGIGDEVVFAVIERFCEMVLVDSFRVAEEIGRLLPNLCLVELDPSKYCEMVQKGFFLTIAKIGTSDSVNEAPAFRQLLELIHRVFVTADREGWIGLCVDEFGRAGVIELLEPAAAIHEEDVREAIEAFLEQLEAVTPAPD